MKNEPLHRGVSILMRGRTKQLTREELDLACRTPLTVDEKRERQAEEQEELKLLAETAYIRNRQAAYPAIGDQLDAILKGFEALQEGGVALPQQTTQLISTWKKVKAKFPKKGATSA